MDALDRRKMGKIYLSGNLEGSGTLLDLDMTRVSVKVNRKGMNYWFSGVLVKLRKATISFVMSVCPSTWKTRLPLDRFYEI